MHLSFYITLFSTEWSLCSKEFHLFSMGRKSSKIFHFLLRICSPCKMWFIGPPEWHSKQHLDRFNCFCMVECHDWLTDIHGWTTLVELQQCGLIVILSLSGVSQWAADAALQLPDSTPVYPRPQAQADGTHQAAPQSQEECTGVRKTRGLWTSTCRISVSLLVIYYVDRMKFDEQEAVLSQKSHLMSCVGQNLGISCGIIWVILCLVVSVEQWLWETETPWELLWCQHHAWHHTVTTTATPV